MLRSLSQIDRRTAAARHLVAWREELVAALGDPSPQKLALIELCTRARAVLDHVDQFLLEQPSLIDRREKKLRPIVLQRTALADHLARLLAQIGLERVPKPVPSLAEYLAQSDSAQSENEVTQETDPVEKEQVSEDDIANNDR
jgi:hypothetical protein